MMHRSQVIYHGSLLCTWRGDHHRRVHLVGMSPGCDGWRDVASTLTSVVHAKTSSCDQRCTLCLTKAILCDISMQLRNSQACASLLGIAWRSQTMAQSATATASCEAKLKKTSRSAVDIWRCDTWTVVTSPTVPLPALRSQPTTRKSIGSAIKGGIN